MVVVVKPQALLDYACQLNGEETRIALPDNHQIGLDRGTGRSLLNYVLFLYGQMKTQPSTLSSPLLLAELQNTFLAMLFDLPPRQHRPITAISNLPAPPGQKTVGAAREFIEAHLAAPLTIERISSMIGVQPRTLHKAFRLHLDTTPMAYVKARRLEQVRKALQITAPSSCTITAVASRWGFTNPGHFSVAFRRAFGESPSMTLHADGS